MRRPTRSANDSRTWSALPSADLGKKGRRLVTGGPMPYLPRGDVHVRVLSPVRPQRVCDRVAVVTPDEVLVSTVAGVTDVIAHVRPGDDGIELGRGEHPRRGLSGHLL